MYTQLCDVYRPILELVTVRPTSKRKFETGRTCLRRRSSISSRNTFPITRSYCTIHPSHKPAVPLPTKEQEEAVSSKRNERAINIIGLSKKELEEEFEHFGLPRYRASQVFQWIYGQGASSFDEMPTLGKKLISQLKDHYYVDFGNTPADSTSNDGTRKWLVDLGNKQCVESTQSAILTLSLVF